MERLRSLVAQHGAPRFTAFAAPDVVEGELCARLRDLGVDVRLHMRVEPGTVMLARHDELGFPLEADVLHPLAFRGTP